MFFRFFIIVSGFFFCNAVFAEQKVAYIDLEYVFRNSNLKIKSDKKTNEQKQRYIHLRNKVETSLRKVNKELRQLELLLGHQEYMKEFNQHKKDLDLHRKELSDIKKGYDEWYKMVQLSLFEELLIAIETISEKENVSIVLSKRPAVLFSQNSLDLSEQVIDFLEDLNQRNSVTAK